MAVIDGIDLDWIQLTMALAAVAGVILEIIWRRKDVKAGIEDAETKAKQFNVQLDNQKKELETHKREVEELKKNRELDAYQALRDHHHELIVKQIEESTLKKVYETVTLDDARKKKFTSNEKIELADDEEMKIFSSYLAEFDLYERVYEELMEKKKIGEYEWVCWLIYLEKISHHWLFEYTYNQTRKIFDSGFMIEVKTIIEQNKKDGAAKYLEDRAKNAYDETYEKKLIIPDEVKL